MQERFEIFTVLINRISRNIKKIKNQEMAEYNLRSSHVSCLYYIYILNGVTMPVIDSLGDEFLNYVKDGMKITVKAGGIVEVE